MTAPEYERLADELMGRQSGAVEFALSAESTRPALRSLLAAAIADGYLRGLARGSQAVIDGLRETGRLR